jgi:hypothetical protein
VTKRRRYPFPCQVGNWNHESPHRRNHPRRCHRHSRRTQLCAPARQRRRPIADSAATTPAPPRAPATATAAAQIDPAPTPAPPAQWWSISGERYNHSGEAWSGDASAPYHCERAPIPPAAAYGFEKSYGSDPQIVNEEYGVTDGVSLLRRAEWNPKEIRTNRYFRTEAACRLALQADLDKEAARTRADAADKKAEDRTLDSYR